MQKEFDIAITHFVLVPFHGDLGIGPRPEECMGNTKILSFPPGKLNRRYLIRKTKWSILVGSIKTMDRSPGPSVSLSALGSSTALCSLVV